MSRPPITILMTTYFPPGPVGATRAEEAIKALMTWREHLRYDGEIRLHIADDGSDPEHYGELMKVAARWVDSTTHADRRGVGGSLNMALIKTMEIAVRDQVPPLWLYLVDDWHALRPFDLTPWADWLLEDDSACMMRFFPHPALTGTVQHNAGRWVMRLDRHHFAFAHRPALWTNKMIRAYGYFAEDVNAYECERLYSERFNAKEGWRPGLPSLDWPDILLALPSAFDHISTVELGDVTPL